MLLCDVIIKCIQKKCLSKSQFSVFFFFEASPPGVAVHCDHRAATSRDGLSSSYAYDAPPTRCEMQTQYKYKYKYNIIYNTIPNKVQMSSSYAYDAPPTRF